MEEKTFLYTFHLSSHCPIISAQGLVSKNLQTARGSFINSVLVTCHPTRLELLAEESVKTNPTIVPVNFHYA